MPYGYLGQNTPNQLASNSGVLSMSDVHNLTKQGKLGGSLELIEEQVISGVTSTIDFTNLGNYDVHLLTVLGYETSGGGSEHIGIRLSNDGGSSYISTSNYQYAQQVCATGGIFTEIRTTAVSYFKTVYTNNTEQGNMYCYLYNLLNSSKYSFISFQGLKEGADIAFGGGVLPVAETHNAIRVFTGSACDIATIKLYGVKQI